MPGLIVGAAAMLVFVPPGPCQDLSNAPPQYASRVWQKEDGLPHEAVEAIIQTRDGYLWAGTQRGLARFNGVEFKVFDAENTPELKSSFISGLWETQDGALWIGTARGGLTRLKEGKFERYEVAAGPEASVVKGVVEGQGGRLWIGAGGGLYTYDEGKIGPLLKKGPWTTGYVRAMCSDQQGGFWVGTASSGVYKVRAGERIVTYSVTNGLAHNSVRSLCVARSGTLWVGTMLGVSGLHPDGTSTYYGPTNGLSDRIVTALFEDRRGTLWIGTLGGLHTVTKGVVRMELTERGAAYGSVSSIADDAEGNVWVGTSDGLHRLRARRFNVYTTQQGLPHDNVTAILEDRAGAVWFATWGGGVCKLENGKMTRLGRKEGLSRDLILTLWQDHAGGMWAGADLGGGLSHLLTDGTRARLGGASLSGTVRVVYEDRRTNLWVGTAAGLYRIQKPAPVRYTVRDGLTHDTIRAIQEDSAGALWVGTSRGLSCFLDGKFTSFPGQDQLTNRTVFAIHEDGLQNLWLGTYGGLVRLHEGQLTSYTTRQGLFDDEVFSVLEDARGTLWMSCPNGVFCVPRKSFADLDAGKADALRCVSFDRHDGMPTTQCSGVGQPAAWKGRDGRLWFPTIRGAAVIAPDAGVEPNDRVPPVFIEEI